MTVLPRSLRGRLLATGALFIALALVATGVAVQLALHRFIQGQIDQRLDGQLLTMASALELRSDGTVELGRNIDGPPFDNPRTGWFWLIRTPTRRWLAGGLRAADVELPAIPPGFFAHPLPVQATAPDGRRVRARVDRVSLGGQDVLLVAAAPLEAQAGPLRDALLPLFTALVVLGGGLIAATLLQVRLGLRPLARLRDGIAAVRSGRSPRLPLPQPEEIGPLVSELNSLLDQHDANLERARRHVANIAHALKTPLAALTIALDRPDHDVAALRDLAGTMDRHIRHHLARARVAALGSATRSTVLLRPRIVDHAAAFGKIYADKRLAVAIDMPEDLVLACDAQDIDEMVGNLLDNACKWARRAVWIEAGRIDTQVRVIVSDDGPGVAPAERALILQRGHRLDESVAGDGFGLAIVQEVAGLYGGTLDLSGREPHGLRATLVLPSAKPTEAP